MNKAIFQIFMCKVCNFLSLQSMSISYSAIFFICALLKKVDHILQTLHGYSILTWSLINKYTMLMMLNFIYEQNGNIISSIKAQ